MKKNMQVKIYSHETLKLMTKQELLNESQNLFNEFHKEINPTFKQILQKAYNDLAGNINNIFGYKVLKTI